MAIIFWFIEGFLVLLLAVGFIANTVGIYLLSQCKSRENVHRIILSFSSTLTLMLIVHSLITGVCQLESIKKQMEIVLHTNRTISAGVFVTYYFTIAVLTLDRLVCLVYPVKYRLSRSKAKKAMMALAGCCVLGLFSLLPFLWHSFNDAKNIYDKYILLSVDVIVFMISLVTYTYIFRMAKNKPQRKLSSGSQQMKSKCIRVSMFITISFVSFVIIPDLILVYHQFIGEEPHVILLHILYFLWVLNYISDPIIYIYFRPDVHKVFKKIVLRKLESRRSSTNSKNKLGIKISDTLSSTVSIIDNASEYTNHEIQVPFSKMPGNSLLMERADVKLSDVKIL